MSTSLPADVPDQNFVSIKPIIAGDLHLPFREVFQDCVHESQGAGRRVPVMCFLLKHPAKGFALFDLGVRKNGEGYPPHVKKMAFEYFDTKSPEDVADILRKGGVQPEEVSNVILSHLHWDHSGDAAPYTSGEIILGAEAQGPLTTEVYPHNPKGTLLALPEGRRITFIDFSKSSSAGRPVISPFATFEQAIDFYDDGSLYLINTPGHFPGHLSALARVAPNTLVLLAGDLCHDRQCYCPGHRAVSEENHRDVELARETVQKLVRLNAELDNVIVLLAHEAERLDEGLPLFPEDIREWVQKQVEKRQADRQKES